VLQNPPSSGRKESVADANDNIQVLVKETNYYVSKVTFTTSQANTATIPVVVPTPL